VSENECQNAEQNFGILAWASEENRQTYDFSLHRSVNEHCMWLDRTWQFSIVTDNLQFLMRVWVVRRKPPAVTWRGWEASKPTYRVSWCPPRVLQRWTCHTWATACSIRCSAVSSDVSNEVVLTVTGACCSDQSDREEHVMSLTLDVRKPTDNLPNKLLVTHYHTTLVAHCQLARIDISPKSTQRHNIKHMSYVWQDMSRHNLTRHFAIVFLSRRHVQHVTSSGTETHVRRIYSKRK